MYQNRFFEIIKLVMKDPQIKIKKQITQIRKYSVSEKTRSDISSPFTPKLDSFTPVTARGMKSLGKKYAQQNIFKEKEKEHHEIVISDEVVRNSKQYRMLRQKMQMQDAIFIKQCNDLSQIKSREKQEIVKIKGKNHQCKLNIWEIKNQILELKGILNGEQQENSRLESELSMPGSNYYEQDEQQQQLINLEPQYEYNKQGENKQVENQQNQQSQIAIVSIDQFNCNSNPESLDKEKQGFSQSQQY